MSQANSDFGDFGDPMEYDGQGAAEEMPAAPTPAAPILKKGFTIYSVMLIISFVMLLTAAIMLFSQIGSLK
jgi:hypothetical protein